MAIYIITILLATLLSYAIQSRKKIEKKDYFRLFLLFILIVGLAFIVGYRFNVGTDFGGYKRMFAIYRNYSWREIFKLKEPGIRIIIKLCSYLTNDYSFYMFICALITTGIPIVILYKHSENFTFSMILYLCVVYLSQCNGMRQALAMSIIFMGYKYIKNKKFWIFIIFPLIASIFHVSALFVIPIYFIYTSKPGWLTALIIIIATLLMRFSYDFLARAVSFFTEEEFVETSYTKQSVNILRIVAMVAPIVLVIPFNKKTLQEQSLSYNLILANACVYICMGGSAYFARLGMFTDMFLCFAIPSLVAKYNSKDKGLVLFIIITCYLAYFIANTMMAGNLVPYQSVLW